VNSAPTNSTIALAPRMIKASTTSSGGIPLALSLTTVSRIALAAMDVDSSGARMAVDVGGENLLLGERANDI
jgi:hypothetical protein